MYYLRKSRGDYWPLIFDEDGPRSVRLRGNFGRASRCECFWNGGGDRFLPGLAFKDDARIFYHHDMPSESMRDLDEYFAETVKSGWIDLEGNFYPTPSGGNREINHGTVMRALGIKGYNWISVHDDGSWSLARKSDVPHTGLDKDLITQAQKDCLIKIGHSPDKHEMKRLPIYPNVADIFPDWPERKEQLKTRMEKQGCPPQGMELDAEFKERLRLNIKQLLRLRRQRAQAAQGKSESFLAENLYRDPEQLPRIKL